MIRKMTHHTGLSLFIMLAGLVGAQATGTEKIYISASGSGTAGGVSFDDEDIMLCDRFGGVPGTCSWSMFFDGSAEGISIQSDMAGFHILDDDNILMTFRTPKKIGGLRKVDDSDIVHFDRNAANSNSAYTFYFDGSDVGLTTDDETIDAIGFDSAGRLVISTDGNYSVPKTGGGTLSGVDADLIVFNGSTGPDTVGTFELYFNGVSAGFNTPQEDIWGVWIDPNTEEIYLTTRGDFSVGALNGVGTDVIVCAPAGFNPIPGCTTVTSFFISSNENYNDKIIDGLFIENNTSPVAQDDSFSMLEDGVLNGNVLADNGNGIDNDPDGDPLTVNTTAVSGPTNGILVLSANGDFTYTPSADFNGTDMFEYEIEDASAETDIGKVTITITAVNDAPSFTKGGDQTVSEDAGAQTVIGWATGISAGPSNESGQTLNFNVTNNTNAALFAAGPSVSASGDLSYTTVAGANGTADITITLMDNGGTANGGVDTSAPQSFNISVTAINDAPSFIKGADETVLEDAGAQSVPGWATAISAGPPDESGQTLTFNITGNTNAGMFSAGPAIDSAGTLTYTAADDANGSADITVTLMDNGGTANGGADTAAPQMFTINVTMVNDVPSFTKGGDQVVQHDVGPQSVDPWATGISVGPANESTQTAAFNITNNTMPGLFAELPAVSASGVLTFTPELNASGTATITLNLMDNGGTANGGVDTSATQSFDITVNTALPPTANDDTFASTGNVGIDYSANTGQLFADNGSGADDNGGGTLIVSKVQNSEANVGVATATNMGGSVTANADGSFTYTPPTGYKGADTFTYTAMNAGGDSQATVTINVSDMIWFIDNSASVGDGDLNTPFNTLLAFDLVNGNGGANEPAASDCIFVYSGSGAYSGPVSLENDQILVGQGATSTTASLCGITPATNSNALPATSGTAPVLISSTNAINLASGNTIRGLHIGDITQTGIFGTAVGALTISEVSIGDASPSGSAIRVTTSGVLSVSFDKLSANSSSFEGIYLHGVSGTFTVIATDGTIQTSGVAAIDIDADPSLAASMTLAKVSSDGGSNGIVLSDTTGSFTVAGDGSTAGSGGTIKNMTGVNGTTDGIGILLNNTQNVALNFMQINDHENFAIRGTGVANFDMDDSVVNGVNGNSAADDEGSIRFTNLTGVAAITGSNIAGGYEDNLRINNSSGVLVMTIKDSVKPNPMIIGLNDTTFGNDGILVETTSTADVTLTIDGVEFKGARGDMLQTNALGNSIQDITVKNSTFLNTHTSIVSGGGGITLSGGGATSNIMVAYDIDGNQFSGAKGNAITANFLSNQGLVTGNIKNNTIGTVAASSGSAQGSGILAAAERSGVGVGDIVHTVLISGNTIRQIAGFAGIEIVSNVGLPGGLARVNATVTNNIISELTGFAYAGMSLLTGGSAPSGDHAMLCSNIQNNTINASGVAFNQAVAFDQISTDARYNLPGYAGSPNGEFAPTAGTASANIGSFLTASGGNTLINGAGAFFPGGVDAAVVVGVTGVGISCP